MIEPDKIEEWMQEVRDDESSVEDYDFLDQLTHGGPEGNASDGLANVGAYLAIYEEDGEITVDEELVEELDSRRGEESSGKRFRNIVYDAQTAKRDENTLLDKEVDGHGFLQGLVDDYRKEVSDNSLPQDNENTNKDGSQNRKSNNKEGGESRMGRIDNVEEMVDDYMSKGMDAVAAAEAAAGDFADMYENDAANMEEVQTAIQELETYVEEKGGDVQAAATSLESKIDDVSDRVNNASDRIDDVYDDLLG